MNKTINDERGFSWITKENFEKEVTRNFSNYKDTILNALLKKKPINDGYLGQKVKIKKQMIMRNVHNQGFAGKVKNFNENLVKNKEAFQQIRHDNQSFSTGYKKVKKSKENIKQVEVFSELVEKYKERGYHLPSTSANHNLFSPSPLLMENSKIKDYYQFSPASDKTTFQKFCCDVGRLEKVQMGINEKRGNDTRKRSRNERGKIGMTSIDSQKGFKGFTEGGHDTRTSQQITEESIALKKEIENLRSLIKETEPRNSIRSRVLNIYPTLPINCKRHDLPRKNTEVSKFPKSRNILNQNAQQISLDYRRLESLDTAIPDNKPEIKAQEENKGSKHRSTISFGDYSVNAKYLTTSKAKNSTSNSISVCPAENDMERNRTFITGIKDNQKRLIELEKIYSNIKVKNMSNFESNVKKYFKTYNPKDNYFLEFTKSCDPSSVHLLLKEVNSKVSPLTSLPKIMRDLTTKNSPEVDFDDKRMKEIENLDASIHKLEYTLVKEILKTSQDK